MDPVSLTASIIAILGAGGAIAKGMRKIHRLKNAPIVLLQLNNEVSDMTLLIDLIDDLVRKETSHPASSAKQLELVCTILSRAKSDVLELEKFIAYTLTKETSLGAEVDRSTWIRSSDGISNAKNNIRRAREDLNTVWATLSQRHLPPLADIASRSLLIG